MTDKQKRLGFLGLTVFPFLVLGSEALVILIQSLFRGTMDVEFIISNITATIIHRIGTYIVWVAGIIVMVHFAKKMEHNVFDDVGKPKLLNWVVVGFLVVISVVVGYISWGFRFKPFVEFASHIRRYGDFGLLLFIGQYIYYLLEVMLFLGIIIFGQKYGELLFKKDNIPWGGFVCGLTWGLGHIFTQNSLLVGILLFFLSISYGIVYLQLKKNVLFSYIVVWVMFVV